VIEGANCLDAKLLVATMEGLVVARPGWEEVDEQQHMCLDAHVPGRGVRLGAGARRTDGERLPASHPSGRQEGEGARRTRASSRWAGQALGSGTFSLIYP
jgi:hypothetical protein